MAHQVNVVWVVVSQRVSSQCRSVVPPESVGLASPRQVRQTHGPAGIRVRDPNERDCARQEQRSGQGKSRCKANPRAAAPGRTDSLFPSIRETCENYRGKEIEGERSCTKAEYLRMSNRCLARRGRLHTFESIDPARTGMLVVDMQNAFVAEGAAAEIPTAREVVPNINRVNAALRRAGGLVVWIVSTYGPNEEDRWPIMYDHVFGEEQGKSFRAALTAGSRATRSTRRWNRIPPTSRSARTASVPSSAAAAGSSSCCATAASTRYSSPVRSPACAANRRRGRRRCATSRPS